MKRLVILARLVIKTKHKDIEIGNLPNNKCYNET